MQSLQGFIFNKGFPCKSPLFIPIQSNSTVEEVITPCLAFVLFPTILTGFSISCLSFLIIYGFIIFSPKLFITKLLITKFSISALIILTSFIRFIFMFFSENKDSEEILGSFCILIISICSFVSYFRCWISGIPSSIWLHLIYFLRFITIIPEAIAIINLSDLCDPDRTRSSLARATFAQAGHLMSKGYKGTIDYDTFWSLDPRNQPERLLILYKKYRSKVTDTKKKFIPWLFFVLFKCTWFAFTAGVLLKASFAFITISDPLFLKLIINAAENNYPLWYGFTLVFTAMIISWAKFSIVCRSDFYGSLGYLDVQSILINVIYQKMLKLSASAKVKYSAGEVVNLLSTDVERIRYFWFNLFDFFYTPLIVSCHKFLSS
uniref:ABC transmembrane type-1 domain-containing protein n=1 Tax=Panagrolaimus davidi TaxID=227884 RepID=A0A914QLM1_9BILA